MKTFLFYTNKISGIWEYFYVNSQKRLQILTDCIGEKCLNDSRKQDPYMRTELSKEDIFAEVEGGVAYKEWQ